MTKSAYLIAEIGINHDGDPSTARRLIESSAKAGSDSVKFQYRNLENAYSDDAFEIGDEILQQEIRRNYLAPKAILQLTEEAKAYGLDAGISFFDLADMKDFGEDLEAFDFFKVPSAELLHSALVDAMLATGKHVYISTGCHTEEELESAFSRLPREGWTPMHCVSNYPVGIQNPRLGYIEYLQKRWERPVGYSSHDNHWEICLLAILLGATVVERHITLNRGAQGLDHSSSSTPDEFQKLSLFAANMRAISMGDQARTPNQGELINRQNLGRSFFVSTEMNRGDILTEDHLVYRSPNSGLNQTNIDKYLGMPVRSRVRKGGPLMKSAFEPHGPLPEEAIEFARENRLSLPVRLHDFSGIEDRFPIGAFEFHLSFREALSDIDLSPFSSGNRYSVHLPDYVNSVLLMDPFSEDSAQSELSHQILNRTVTFSSALQELTGEEVPVVGSFSVIHEDLGEFHNRHHELVSAIYEREGVQILPQWLPPIAWYFGGSVPLHVMNSTDDVAMLRELRTPICMDICHLIMGQNYFGFSATDIVADLKDQISHIHIADAAGFDGEGLPFGEGEPANMDLINDCIGMDAIKVIEVWQGHLDSGAGFHKALLHLSGIRD